MKPVDAMDLVLWEQEFEPQAELRIIALLHEMDDKEDAWLDYFED